MQPRPQLYVTSRDDWRSWLEKNHDTTEQVWLVFFKKAAGQPGISYEDALDEALCFGWIDSLVKKIDGERYVRKFTPRTGKASWSAVNKTKAERLIREGRMTQAGLRIIQAAKKNGNWEEAPASEKQWDMPVEFTEGLDRNETAKNNFVRLSPSRRKQYVGWIASAKLEETRRKRAAEAVERLARNEQLGMK